MDLNSYVKPLLTEPGTKYFLNASLNIDLVKLFLILLMEIIQNEY